MVHFYYFVIFIMFIIATRLCVHAGLPPMGKSATIPNIIYHDEKYYKSNTDLMYKGHEIYSPSHVDIYLGCSSWCISIS